MRDRDKYNLTGIIIINDYEYGILEEGFSHNNTKQSLFYALADGWEIITLVQANCPDRFPIFRLKRYIKKKNKDNSDRFEMMDL